MANKLLSTMTMPNGSSYDIDAKYLSGTPGENIITKLEELESGEIKYLDTNGSFITTTFDDKKVRFIALADSFDQAGPDCGVDGEFVTFSDGSRLGLIIDQSGFTCYWGYETADGAKVSLYEGSGSTYASYTKTREYIDVNFTGLTVVSGTSIGSTLDMNTWEYGPLTNVVRATKVDAATVYTTTEGPVRIPITDTSLTNVDLGGKTLYFDTTDPDSFYARYFNNATGRITFTGGYMIDTSMSPPSMTVCGTEVYNVTNTPNWNRSSFTLPPNVGSISGISGWTGTAGAADIGEAITVKIEREIKVDCEYNYKEIQKLKNTVEVANGESVDMVDLRSGDIIGENCTIYFPVGDMDNGKYFYGETGSMLYDTNLIEFSDGTRIYGKSNEGYALYINYQGEEETLWSSGGWYAAGKNAQLAESSKYILEKGTKLVTNNMYLYDCRGQFFVSNAITTTKSTMYPNFSSEQRPYEALSEKIIAWSGEDTLISDYFKAPFVVQGYENTLVYPPEIIDVNIVPEIWMRVIELGNNSGYALAFAEVDSNSNLTALGVCPISGLSNNQISPASILASNKYASYAIKKRLDSVHFLYLASNPNVEREPFYLPVGSRMVNFEDDGCYPWILAFSDQYTGTTQLKTIGLTTGTYNRINTNNWSTTGTTITIDETQVEEFSKLFKILDNVLDLDTPAVHATNSILKTVSPVEISHGYTDWINLPSLTIDITKERVAGIWCTLSGSTNYNVYFTVEELQAVGMAADITAILVTLDNLPDNMAFGSVQESLSIGYSGDSICNARLNVVRGSCPTYTYNWQIKLNWGTYPSSAYTVGYVVETLVPDANNSYGYTY